MAIATAAASGASYPNVRALRKPYGDEAADKLQEASNKLRKASAPSAADRLLRIDGAVLRLDFAGLERLAAPQEAIGDVVEAQEDRVRRVHTWRNVAALTPLLLTWFALAWAALLYQEELASHAATSARPFLLLWEQRFGGRFTLTFSETAFLDMVLLLAVLMLTFRAHRVETSAKAVCADVAHSVDEGMRALAGAVDLGAIRPPASAEDWATAARQILADAMEQTEQLAATSSAAIDAAKEELKQIQADGRTFISDLARESLATLVGVRDENKEFIAETANEAKGVLQQAAAESRQVVDRQIIPLVEQLRTILSEFELHNETYRVGVGALTQGVTELSAASQVLAGSAKSYTDIAASINDHLRLIQTSQSDFISRVTDSVSSMTTAATAMHDVSDVLRQDLRADLSRMAANVATASEKLSAADQSLAETSRNLGDSAVALRDVSQQMTIAATALRASIGPRRRRWRRLFHRR